LSERTLLFLSPIILLAVAAGLAVVATGAPPRLRAAAFTAGAMLLLFPAVRDTTARWARPVAEQSQALRSITAGVWRRVVAGEPVYVFSRDVPIWVFYTTDWRHPDTARVAELIALASSTGPNSGNAPPRRWKRSTAANSNRCRIRAG
jgi:antitoxin (DNA-binding transcriptional repressor) of toxin-antitoxin stability system